MFQIKLRRPGRGIILAVVAVIVLVGAVGFGILEARAANKVISEAKEKSATFGGQMRDNAEVFEAYRNGFARTGRSRKLIDEAESAQKKLGIIQARRKELVNTVEELGTAERMLVQKHFEGALGFCDEQIMEYQSQFDDLFERLSVRTPVFADLRKRRNGRIRFFQFGISGRVRQ